MNNKLFVVLFLLFIISFVFISPVSALTPEERAARRAAKVEKMLEKINNVTRSIASNQEKYCGEFLDDWPELDPIWFCDIDVPEPVPPIPESGLLISEVYGNGTNQNEWVELYNGSDSDVSVDGYKLEDNSATRTILDAGAIVPARGFLVIFANPTQEVIDSWNIPDTANTIKLNANIGSGLSENDRVLFKDSSDVSIDAVSWGTDTTAFTPAAIPLPNGYSLSRSNIKVDNNTYRNWIIRSVSTPGK